MKFLDKYAGNIITVLVVAALVLGYVLVGGDGTKTKKNNISNEPAIIENAEVLKTPSLNASEEEKKRHFETALSIAKEAEYLSIGNCLGSPTVLKTKVSDPVKIKNPDQVDHTIVFNEGKRYPIKAGETKTVSGLFENGPGLYGYGCDSLPNAVGLFLATPE